MQTSCFVNIQRLNFDFCNGKALGLFRKNRFPQIVQVSFQM